MVASYRRAKNIIDLGERGYYNSGNKLNNLTGKEWIKFSKTWFIHHLPGRKKNELLHPAKFPETLAAELISFFTKEREWILDSFMGTGSSLIAAGYKKRNAVGIELSNMHFKIAKKRIEEENFENLIIPLLGSSEQLTKTLNKLKIKKLFI